MNINALIAGVEDYGSPLYTDGISMDELLNILSFGGTILLIGILTVFAVLIIIWVALVLFRFAFSADRTKKKTKIETAEAPVEAPVFVSQSADEEIVAVIAAAIAMAESESNGMKFRVVSFRRR